MTGRARTALLALVLGASVPAAAGLVEAPTEETSAVGTQWGSIRMIQNLMGVVVAQGSPLETLAS